MTRQPTTTRRFRFSSGAPLRALATLLALLAACGGNPQQAPPDGVDAVQRSLSTIDCTESTDTGYVKGKPFPITVVSVDGKKVEVQTANAYYVMAQAAAKAGVNIKVVSGFRTNAEQTYFYNCYINCNCNNCNLAAKPGYSNHQSGHALDLNTASAGVFAWLKANGATYGFSKTVPSEDWHWEWWNGGPGGGPCGKPTYPRLTIAATAVEISGQPKDLCQRGSSGTIFDLWVGQKTDYDVDVKNEGDAVAKAVEVGLWSEAPYLQVLRWNIYSDHNQPAGTFALNDTDGLQTIPHDKPGTSFKLTLGSVSPGETKRVRLRIEALKGSLHGANHPEIRAWVASVEGYYQKSDYSAPPSLNKDGLQTQSGGDLKARVPTDLLDKEVCSDGVDNDCNGQTDEHCGAGPDAGVGTPDAGSGIADGSMDESFDGSGCSLSGAAPAGGLVAPLVLALLLCFAWRRRDG